MDRTTRLETAVPVGITRAAIDTLLKMAREKTRSAQPVVDATITIRLAMIEAAAAISGLILRPLQEVNIQDHGPALIAEQSLNWTVDGVISKTQSRITYVAIDDGDIVGTAGFDGQQA